MQISLLLAHEIAQLFLILLAGFVLVRAGLLRAADSKVLSVILVYLRDPLRPSSTPSRSRTRPPSARGWPYPSRRPPPSTCCSWC